MVQRSSNASIEQQDFASLLVADSSGNETHEEARNDDSIDNNAALAVPDLGFTPTEGEYIDWSDPNIDFTNFLNPQVNDEAFQFSPPFPISRSLSLVRNATPPATQTTPMHRVFSPIISIPPQPTFNIRSLTQRPKVKTATQSIAKLILHTLKSYPMMMQNHNNLPPFIHPHLLSSNAKVNNMEPLTNCINLVYMISSQMQGSRKLFWKNVRLECERLCEEVC
jgi:hypothetical protein